MIEQVAEPLQQATFAKVVLELEVNNHPGVMSHICNLFARRQTPRKAASGCLYLMTNG